MNLLPNEHDNAETLGMPSFCNQEFQTKCNSCSNNSLGLISKFNLEQKKIRIVGNGEESICPSCREIFSWPELTQCGHIIDKQCVGQNCPVCFKRIVWTAPNVMAEREVKKLVIHCVNEDSGCQYMTSIERMGAHISCECEYERMVCFLD